MESFDSKSEVTIRIGCRNWVLDTPFHRGSYDVVSTCPGEQKETDRMIVEIRCLPSIFNIKRVFGGVVQGHTKTHPFLATHKAILNDME
jgi:hypothetical protein